jgi:hypothetical protein
LSETGMPWSLSGAWMSQRAEVNQLLLPALSLSGRWFSG